MSLNVTPPQISCDELERELINHPDKDFTDYLINGIRTGFDTGISILPCHSCECKNSLSCRKDPVKTTELIETELKKGYVIGPFHEPPFDTYRINPISLAERKYSGKKRLVVDMSAPHNDSDHPSINDLISKEDFRLSYVKLDEAIEIIQSLGHKTKLCKTDLVDAFKLLPVKREVWPYQGICWHGKYYFFTRLVFGCRSSCKIFDHLSRAIVWIAKHNYGIQNMLHILDDFLTLDSPHVEATRTMALLTLLLNKLNIPYSVPKTIGPATQLEYVGLIVDTDAMQCCLPMNKLTRISNLVDTFLGRSKCTKLELLSLLGHLAFATRVIPPGRTFMFRLFKAAHTVKRLHHHVYLNNEAKADLNMWSQFLEHWNGVSLFINTQEIEASDMHLFTDASGLGFGGYFRHEYFYGPWPKDLMSNLSDDISISFQELYPIVIAAIHWGQTWSRKRIVFNCDNEGTVYILNKGRSKSADIMKLMRRLTLVAAQYSFCYTAKHVRGRDNRKADCLSRFQLEEFHRLAPEARVVPCPIPSEVLFA